MDEQSLEESTKWPLIFLSYLKRNILNSGHSQVSELFYGRTYHVFTRLKVKKNDFSHFFLSIWSKATFIISELKHSRYVIDLNLQIFKTDLWSGNNP